MDTRDRIIDAAVQIFAASSRHGAHIKDIASVAHINVAMIYYIFRNKDELYLEVLKHVFKEVFLSLSEAFNIELCNSSKIRDQIAAFISFQSEFFFNNRDYAKIMMDAFANGVKEMPQVIQYLKETCINYSPLDRMRALVDKGVTDKSVRRIDADQLVISIIGMVQVYFINIWLFETLGIDIEDENKFIESRRVSIIDLVMNGIGPDRNAPV